MPRTNPPKILLVDDDPIFTSLATEILQRSGATVTTSSRLGDADRLMSEHRYDVAIIDGLLPDGSGMEFIKRRRHGGDYTPMVFCSAFWRDRASHTTLTQSWGVEAVLTKPMAGEQELLKAVSPFCSDELPVQPSGQLGKMWLVDQQ